MAINFTDQNQSMARTRASLSRGISLRAVVLALALAIPMAMAHAQASIAPAVQPANLVSLSASGFLEVPQDWLTVRLSVSREGNDAASVQSQLRKALDSGMAVARAAVAPNQQLQARSGAFGVYPSYDKNGKINGWQGKAELVLEGRDFTKIANTAGNIDSMAISGMGFTLSRETRQKLESDVQALAIDRFQARAKEVAKGFGFDGFQLREVNVSSADEGADMPIQQMRAMAMEAKSMVSASRAVAVEPGMSRVTVNVSGTVALK